MLHEFSQTLSTAPVRALVPMIHVADVERSIEFYRVLGFEAGDKVPPAGRLHWAWLYAPNMPEWRQGPNLMLTRGARALNLDAQDVLFYLYATNLAALRSELVEKGLKPDEICYPEYLPEGEFRLHDPDGYCLMIAQSGAQTP